MRCLLLFAAILGAASGRRPGFYAATPHKDAFAAPTTIEPITPNIETSTLQQISSEAPSKEPNALEEVVSNAPSSLPPILEELNSPQKRRIISYDQRQEGQYNIRADLDNIMLVFIPSTPAEGLSLLELLSKSNLGRTASSSKSKKKHYSLLKPEVIKHKTTLKNNADNLHIPSYFNVDRQGQQHSPLAVGSSQGRIREFIEGRTPYHVDISSLSEDVVQPRLNPDRQVDVLPPPYPLAYTHLMKPYNLDAEATVIQTLPPSELAALQNSGKLLEIYQAEKTNSKFKSIETQARNLQSGYYRLSRAIRGDSFLDNNRVTSSNSLGFFPSSHRRSQLPLYRTEFSLGAAQLYPPLDVPHYDTNANARSFDLKSSPISDNEDGNSNQSLDNDLPLGEIIIPPADLPLEDDLEFDVHNAGFIDAEAKALLSDGIERCAPGKRRDSYGVCREIEGY